MSELTNQDRKDFLTAIREIPDYPKEGIIFKDITTILNDGPLFKRLIDGLVTHYKTYELDYIAGIDARGFIFGAAVAAQLGIGFVPIRKKGKLPYDTIGVKYDLEYGTDEIEIHTDAFHNKTFHNENNARVLLIDDLVATGGTAEAAVKLINQLDATCVEACFFMSLEFLEGRKKIEALAPVFSVLEEH